MKEAILLIFTLIILAASPVLTTSGGTANIVFSSSAIIPQAYAGEEKEGDNDDDDGNKQKVEDESAAAIADCDDNEVEEDTNFDCIARATSEEGKIRDIERPPPTPTPEPEPEPEPETATLRVCKEITGGTAFGFEPSDFTFIVTGNNPSPAQFPGDDIDGCVDVTIGPGAYTIEEGLPGPMVFFTGVTGDCIGEGPAIGGIARATGQIESGQTETCTLRNLSA
jgi:hypothetical protein